jgi:hypothetical protein
MKITDKKLRKLQKKLFKLVDKYSNVTIEENQWYLVDKMVAIIENPPYMVKQTEDSGVNLTEFNFRENKEDGKLYYGSERKWNNLTKLATEEPYSYPSKKTPSLGGDAYLDPVLGPQLKEMRGEPLEPLEMRSLERSVDKVLAEEKKLEEARKLDNATRPEYRKAVLNP